MNLAGFHSLSLIFNQMEKNYISYGKEIFIIINSLKKFKLHLIGIKFDILTNHIPLTHSSEKLFHTYLCLAALNWLSITSKLVIAFRVFSTQLILIFRMPCAPLAQISMYYY